MAAREYRLKVVLTKAGEEWDSAKTYALLDYIAQTDGVVYVSKKADNTGHELTDTEWWDKVIDLNTYITKMQTATEACNTATDGASKVNAVLDDDNVLTITDREGNSKSVEFPPYAEDYYTYGIEFDTEVSSPTCTRIGNMTLHRTLPIQNRMKGCLLDDDGNVVEYLDPQDWTSATRDGSRGQVMVELPEHWRKCETDGTKRRVRISEYEQPGYHKVPKMYVSAYEAALDRTNSKLASVVNTDAQYRGGNNKSDWDGTYRSLLGRPATQISRTNFRKYARNRKSGSTEWNLYTYDAHKAIYWLFVIEYATLNSQADYTAELTSEGYHQGGLGAGVTTFGYSGWTNFNGYEPFIPCGHTDSLGNGTGTVSYTAENDDASISKTFDVPRYRGIENPFGHVWKWTDGINIRKSADEGNGGDGLSKVFVCSDPSKFNDSNYDGYSYVGNEARSTAWVKEIIFGEYGEIIAKTTGGSSTTYFCDQTWCGVPTSGELLIILAYGGSVYGGSSAGLTYTYSVGGPTKTDITFGTRLCFIPE